MMSHHVCLRNHELRINSHSFAPQTHLVGTRWVKIQQVMYDMFGKTINIKYMNKLMRFWYLSQKQEEKALTSITCLDKQKSSA